jgi:hypothetical protein
MLELWQFIGKKKETDLSKGTPGDQTDLRRRRNSVVK